MFSKLNLIKIASLVIILAVTSCGDDKSSDTPPGINPFGLPGSSGNPPKSGGTSNSNHTTGNNKPETLQTYFCVADVVGNFCLTRESDMKRLDDSCGSLEFCKMRIPKTGQKYYCKRDVVGNFIMVNLSTGQSVGSGTSIQSCLESLPVN